MGGRGEGSGYGCSSRTGRAAYAPRGRAPAFRGETRRKAHAPSRPGLFAPPPLAGALGGLALVGGAFHTPLSGGGSSTYGYLEVRPSLMLDKTLSLDAFVGDALTADGSEILYGLGATVYLAPSWAVCVLSLTSEECGLSVLPNSDSFVPQAPGPLRRPRGGGLLITLRWRILVRLEVTNPSRSSLRTRS